MIGLTALVYIVLAMQQSAGYATYQKANAMFVKQDFAGALAGVEEALRLDPKLVPALTLHAKLAMASNRFDLAGKSLEAALAVDPKAQYAQFLYGMTAYMASDMQAALPRFREAHKLNPADARATLYLGLTAESLGETTEALALYQQAVRLEKAAGAIHVETLLPGARLLLLMGRLDEAEPWLRQAVQIAPQDRDAHFEMARLMVRKGAASQAAAEGEKALALAGGMTTDAQIHYLLIRAWQGAGDMVRAQGHAAALRALETPAQKE